MGFAAVHRRRDRAQRIYGGANEIMKEIIGRTN
jgi:alkylation response protein AidB-like acyl-CoA dehydrogenase